MSKRFKLHKEFFGGILYDTITKKNICIDKELFTFVETLIKSKNVPVNTSKDELLEIINELISHNVLVLNVNLSEPQIRCEDHLTAPFRIFYDITYDCNLCCKHCFTNSGFKREKELSLSEKIKLVTEIKELGTSRISIAGGEPFVCPDFFPFLECCKKNSIDVSVTTNGTLFTQPIIEQLNEYNLKNLTVSFDGGTKNSFDIIRGEGSYDRVINGLKLLSEYYNYDYAIKVTLMKNNISEIDNIIETAIKYNCNTIKFNCVRDDGRATGNKAVIINNEDYVNTIKYIESIRGKYEDKIRIKAPLNIFCDSEYEYIEELGFGCFAGKESICISPIGDVKPCSHFPQEFVCGNIRDNNLFDIWHHSEILYGFRHIKGNEQCNNCDQYDKCRAGCRFRAFRSGNINNIDPFCYVRTRNNER